MKIFNKIKIVFFISQFSYGGTARFILNLLNSLSKKKFDILLVVFQDDGKYLKFLDGSIKTRLLHCSRSRYVVPKVVRLLKVERPEVIVSTSPEVMFSLYLSRLFSRVGVRFLARESSVVSVRDAGHSFLKKKVYKLFYKFCIRSVDFFIFQTQYAKKDFYSYFKIKDLSCEVINNFVEHQADYVNYEHKSSGACLIFAGRLSHEKGLDLLLRAISLIDNQEVSLTILGAGPDREALEKQVDLLQLGNKVTFAGQVDDAIPIIAKHDLLILPSRFDAFPNVVLEAHACGVPVVAFNCPGGIDEIIQDGINGLKVKPERVDLLAKAIMVALKMNFNREEIKRLNALKYGAKHIVSSYEKIFLKLLG